MDYSGISAKAQRKYSNSRDFQHVTEKTPQGQGFPGGQKLLPHVCTSSVPDTE